MQIKEDISIAISQLKSNKMRSFLTTIGITIGIATVIFIVSVLEGYYKSMEAEMNALGANVFQIQKDDDFSGIKVGHDRNKKSRKKIKVEIAKAIRENATLVDGVGAELWKMGRTIVYKDKKTNPNISVAGGEPDFFLNNGYFVDAGRGFTWNDIYSNKKIAVLGMDVVDILFPFENPLNKIIKINGHKFKVTGILERAGSSTFGGSNDNRVAIPISTFMGLFGSRRSANITVRIKDGISFEEAKNQVVGIVRKERKVPPGEKNDFAVWSNDNLMESFSGIAGKIQLVAVLLGMISLLVGSIGVMNIMLVTVTERTKEIGIRKAVGARSSTILFQFLNESVMLSIFGGIVGLLIGVILAWIVSIFLQTPFAVPVWAIITSIAVTTLVGLTAGLYPAAKAAKMNAIDALRYE
jgi:putative ABC transport system permease protein